MKKVSKQLEKMRERLKYRGFEMDPDLERIFEKYLDEAYDLGFADGYDNAEIEKIK